MIWLTSLCSTDSFFICRKWDDDLLQLSLNSLTDELVLDPTVPGGMPDYRLSLALSFFYKFYLTVLQQCTPQLVPPQETSAIKASAYLILLNLY